ncbi:MAG: SCP2 sterol-binding domain-containing protein [Halobacteriales archaeon]
MGIAFPDEAHAWIRDWREQLNDSAEYAEAGQGWGQGFNGSFLFVIEADEEYDGEPAYQYVDLEDGQCLEARAIEDPDAVDWGFAYRAGYSDWKALIQGDVGPVRGLITGRFELDGDMQKVLQYREAAMVMAENAAEVDTEFVY